MGRKRTPGLYLRKDIWQIDKVIDGIRLCESSGASDLEEAERYLAKRIKEIREAKLYGVRPVRTFREAATKFLLENQHLRSIRDYVWALKILDGFIGTEPIDNVHMGTLKACIDARKLIGSSERTINYLLQVVRRILNLASEEWVDEHGLTWLSKAPKIKLLKDENKREPYPLSWEEQDRLFALLPRHYRRPALFKVNTGCRDQEVCALRWEWEVKVPEYNTSIFIIPSAYVKNKSDRLIVLNQAARDVVEQVRNEHPVYVFTYKGQPLSRINNKAWRAARKAAGLSQVRVHDLKHTFGRRLRAAEVSFENMQDLLGHKTKRGITTHYSSAEIGNLIEAANKACNRAKNTPILRVIKNVVNG